MSQLWFRQAVAETAELRQQTPGSLLADLSLHFADHPSHHDALSYFCAATDEYFQQHGMTVIEAVRHGYTAAVFAYGDGGCDG